MTKRQITAHKGGRDLQVKARLTQDEKTRLEAVRERYGLSLSDYLMMKVKEDEMKTSKLSLINEGTGLRAAYGGGDYTVTVWNDMEGGYDLVFCKANTDIAHDRINITAEQLETEMRRWQPDLRRWMKVQYDQQ